MTPPRPIGVFGGTFNPVHHGHLLCARDLREALALETLYLVPNSVSPLRRGETALAEGTHRLAMLRLALAGEQGLVPCGIEVERGGVSYTVDTLEALRQRHPDAPLYFLAGADSLRTLDRWVRIDTILRLATIVIMHRPGYPVAGELQALRERAPALADALRPVCQARHLEISSTEIRTRLAAGTSIRYLVPDAVEAYIRQHRLYLPA